MLATNMIRIKRFGHFSGIESGLFGVNKNSQFMFLNEIIPRGIIECSIAS